MKSLNVLLCGLLLCVGTQAMALPTDHPANPEAAVPAFRPADYFSQQAASEADAEHLHESATAPAAADESGSQDMHAVHHHDAHDQPAAADDGAALQEQGEGKHCNRGGCCCCCKCCGKDNHEANGVADKESCGMMKKGMMMQGEEKPKSGHKTPKAPAAKKGEGHEAHH